MLTSSKVTPDQPTTHRNHVLQWQMYYDLVELRCNNTNGVFMATNQRAATPMDEQLSCSRSPWPEMAGRGRTAAGLHCHAPFWCWPSQPAPEGKELTVAVFVVDAEQHRRHHRCMEAAEKRSLAR